MSTGRTAEERFFETLRQMQARIDELERKPMQIPVLDADPSSDYKGNIWMFQDGRLHARLPDGTIKEFTGLTSSGSSSGTPKPVVPAAPVSQTAEWGATWTQAYRSNGAFTGGDAEKLYYGNSGSGSYNGRQTSLIGFDYAAIQTALASSTITKVEVYLYNIHTWGNSGGTVHFGLHNNASKPGTLTGITANNVSKDAVKRNQSAYHPVATSIGAALRDGTARGIVLQAPSDSVSYYGYAAGIGDGPPIPKIRVTYTK